MPLTKSDLSAIRNVVKEEVSPIKSDVSMLKTDVSGLKKGLLRIEKKFDKLFNFLDRKYIEVKDDIRGIQAHLHLPISEY